MLMLRRFQIEFSDVDRGIYESLDFRAAQHPSETTTYLVTRALAFALSFQSNLEFTPGGLSDPESPALRALTDTGAIELWIEIGNPSARKLHKAKKVAKRVIVYTYKNADALAAEIQTGDVFKGHEIEIYAFDPKFLAELESRLEKNNRWTVLIQDGHLNVQIGEHSAATSVRRIAIGR